MGSLACICHGKKLSLFLNISFLFLLSVFLIVYSYPFNSHILNQSRRPTTTSVQFLDVAQGNVTCADIYKYPGNEAKCEYVRTNKACTSQGYINYLHLFYCTFGHFPLFGYTLLLVWLVILFYILGNTAANYFCSSLERLSRALKLSPTIAGVTLLSLGNGANDVFASMVSFMGNGTGGVGLNSILGGVFFLSSIVVGVISISLGAHQLSLDRASFIRDVLFLLLSLCSLLVILIVGKINVWGAMCFISLYFVYLVVVSTTHFCGKKKGEENIFDASPILPITNNFEYGTGEDVLSTPLLGFIDDEKPVLTYNNGAQDGDQKAITRCISLDSLSCHYLVKFLYILELPLYLPRRLTIPVVSEEKWSKPCAVISVTLAPVLFAVLWNSQRGELGTKTSLAITLTSVLVGITFGTVALVTTKRSRPPKRCLLPWLLGGFLMSITWSYIIADELVSLLVSLGNIFSISPSILGLTLLAWGNSLGDLIANLAMATKGGADGHDGVQVAISGCYAGPIFNTLVGLGLSLVLSCWSEYPSSYVIPKDPSLYETLAFIMSGLLWALIILPRRSMKLDRVLGGGLVAIYLCFLCVRMAQTLGMVQIH